jgi:hypothetical protein
MDLPENYAFSQQRGMWLSNYGIDKYYYIQKVDYYGDTNLQTIIIEIGENLIYDYELNEITELTRTVDKIDGNRILWSSFGGTGINAPFFVAETAFTIPGRDNLMMKVLVAAETEAELEELKAIARTLTLANQ